MKNVLLFLLAAVLLLGCGRKGGTAAGPAAKKTGPVLARVGDETLTRDELMILFRGQVPPDVPRDRLQAVLESWANGEVWYQEASRLGIGKDETTHLAFRNEEHNFIAKMLLARIQDTISVTDADVYDYFTKHKDDFMVSTSIYYLMLYDSALAERVAAQVKSGADFVATARGLPSDQVSFDTQPTSYFVRNDSNIPILQFSPELNQTIFSLQPGDASGIVKVNVQGKNTFWIVKCRDRKKVKSDVRFDDVKLSVRAELLPVKQQEVLTNFTDQLTKKTKVEILTDNFYPAAPRPPAGK